MNRFLSLAAAAAIAVSLGCSNTSSTGGVPGTKDSFTLKGPAMSTTIKQGEQQTVKLNLDRGSDFKRTVKMDAVPPKGLKADLASKTILPADAAETTMTISADKDCPLGEHKIHLTATPDGGGNPSGIDVTVKVEEKK
jgi:hypothetical protein